MRRFAGLFAAIASFTALLAGAPTAGAEQWQTLALQAPAGYIVNDIRGLNDLGDVVGDVQDATNYTIYAAKWDHATGFHFIPTPDDGQGDPEDYFIPEDINDKGQIVGSTSTAANYSRPVVLAPNGDPTFLPSEMGPLLHWESAGNASGLGINNAGQATGNAMATVDASDGKADDQLPFLSNGGSIANLWPNPSSRSAYGLGLDVSDGPQPKVLAEGYDGFAPAYTHAYLFSGPGSYTEYEIRPGWHGLNDKGHVAGELPAHYGESRYAVSRARMWNGDQYVDLDPAGGQYSLGNGINDFDWVVGREGGSAGNFLGSRNVGGNAYLWRPGPKVTNSNDWQGNPMDLNTVKGAGWVQLMDAVDINEQSQIAGIGYYLPPGADSYVPAGFLMTPSGFGFTLSGKVTDAAGAPISGVTVRVVRRFSGQEVSGPVTTGADGTYKWTLPPGNYDVTALPDGSYPVVPVGWCQVVGAACRIALDRNREVSFRRRAPVPPAISNASFAAGSFPASAGTKLRLTLSQAASVRVVVTKRVKGHKVGGKCSPRAKTGPPCTLIVQKGSFSYDGKKGPNAFAFRPATLKPGAYSAGISAHNATGTSRTTTLAFAIE